MDTKLRIVDQNSMSLFLDKDLFRIFNQLDPANEAELFAADRQVTAVLSKNIFPEPGYLCLSAMDLLFHLRTTPASRRTDAIGYIPYGPAGGREAGVDTDL
ncbi:hypothetical protein ACFTAO_39230 [Paenibacillus rhizoplanae]